MKRIINKQFSTTHLLIIFCGFLFQGCGEGNSPVLPPRVVFFHAYYKNQFGADLLDTQILGSYSEKNLKVISMIEKDGVIKEYNFDAKGITIEYDDSKRKNYFGTWIPTNSGEKPIVTYVYLSSSDVDTITYSFSPTSKFPFMPDSLFYNKKLMWLQADIHPDTFQSFTITK